MNYNPHKHHRRSIRLQGYDYSRQGAYFITLCTPQYLPLFGKIENSQMIVNDLGQAIETIWSALPKHYKNVELDAFVVMPNHIHGIMVLNNDSLGVINHAPTHKSEDLQNPDNPVGAQFIAPKKLGCIIRGFKARCTYYAHMQSNDAATPIWQRNYYEHIIRNEESLEQIRTYILNNPANWKNDSLFI